MSVFINRGEQRSTHLYGEVMITNETKKKIKELTEEKDRMNRPKYTKQEVADILNISYDQVRYYSEPRYRAKSNGTEGATLHRILKQKIKAFCRGDSQRFTVEEFLNKVGNNPVCYLTGKKIDLNKPSTYHFDHIIPRSKGGSNELDNCQITIAEVNLGKRNLLKDDFIKMCEDVVKFNL